MTDTTNRCQCGQPVPDGFLCTDCTDQLRVDLEQLRNFLPDLLVMLTRQANTTHGRGRPEQLTEPAPAVSTRKLTQSETIGLVSTPLVYDLTAADTLGEVRATLATWCRHLCTVLGLDPADALEAA